MQIGWGLMAGFCGHCNEPSCSMQAGNFLII